MATAHTLEQPGLQKSSWDSENDLMKEFIVEVNTGSGWLAMFSEHTAWVAELLTTTLYPKGKHSKFKVRVWNQFTNGVVMEMEI